MRETILLAFSLHSECIICTKTAMPTENATTDQTHIYCLYVMFWCSLPFFSCVCVRIVYGKQKPRVSDYFDIPLLKSSFNANQLARFHIGVNSLKWSVYDNAVLVDNLFIQNVIMNLINYYTHSHIHIIWMDKKQSRSEYRKLLVFHEYGIFVLSLLWLFSIFKGTENHAVESFSVNQTKQQQKKKKWAVVIVVVGLFFKAVNAIVTTEPRTRHRETNGFLFCRYCCLPNTINFHKMFELIWLAASQ